MARIVFLGPIPRLLVALVLFAFASSFLSSAASAEGRKLALVIGNDSYEQQPALAKAVGDAHAMRATLEKLGFEVRQAENLDYARMVDTLANFQSAIEPGDTVAFHFSGHGVASNGRNYLLPVDFPQLASSRQGEVMLPRLAFDAAEIVDGLRAQGAALTLAVFDACRDNALTSGTRAIGMSRGLVRMDPPRGVFVMFSAGPGELAADRLSDADQAATSVFTRVFIPILETPGLTLVEIAKRTQVKVSELAATVDHQQFPDYSDRVIGDVVLVPKAESAPSTSSVEEEIAAVAPTTTPPSVQGEPTPVDADAALCDAVAGDPYDPLLPASVDRSRLFDLEWVLDFAIVVWEARSAPDQAQAPIQLERMPEVAAACEAAMKRYAAENRFAYQHARAVCLSGASEKCAEAIKLLASLDYPSAKKFLAFVTLSTLGVESPAGGLPEMMREVHADEWFGLPREDASSSAGIVKQLHGHLRSASSAGDLEARSLLPLFEESDPSLRDDRLQIAGMDGLPIGLAAIATYVNVKSLTPEMRTLLNTAIDGGSRLARIMILSDYEQEKTPDNIRRAKEVLAPAVAAGSPTAAIILKKIEADEASLATAPEASVSPAETPAAPSASSGIDFGDDTSSYANNQSCDDRRFTGPGMTTTGLIGADVGHDATDCSTAFAVGGVTLQWPVTQAGKDAAAAIDFGDDASKYAKDGLCDDSRFSGTAMSDTTLIEADIGHDATDCRTAFEAERLTLQSGESAPASSPTASADISFGDDESKWANDGECDDSRFTGEGMSGTSLIDSDIGHDATDCRTAFEAGRLSLR